MTTQYHLLDGQQVELIDGVGTSVVKLHVREGELEVRMYGPGNALLFAFCGLRHGEKPPRVVWHYAASRITVRPWGGAPAAFSAEILR